MQRLLLPPVLFVLLLGALIALAALTPSASHRIGAEPVRIALAVLCVAAGPALLVGARLEFVRNGSEIMTFAEPRHLVTSGPFRVSRNPMYLGFALLLAAAALASNSWLALLAPLAFLLVAQLWYVPHEERNARRAFGSDYDAYAARTRRWL